MCFVYCCGAVLSMRHIFPLILAAFKGKMFKDRTEVSPKLRVMGGGEFNHTPVLVDLREHQ